MPTRWTRTTASPGPGRPGSAVSMRFQFLGDSRERAFMSILMLGALRLSEPEASAKAGLADASGSDERIVILRSPFDIEPIMNGPQDVQDLTQQVLIQRRIGPGNPFAHVLG